MTAGENAAPSLQAEEAVAATDQEIAELRRWSPCVARGVECSVSDFHAPCDEVPDLVPRLLARIAADASTIATLRKALEDVRVIASNNRDAEGFLDWINDIVSAALDEGAK